MENVVTYFEDLSGPSNRPLLELWQANWASKGWNPIVLTIDDAKRHPYLFLYERLIAELPTVNSLDYEKACWMRWLAYEVYFSLNDLPVGAHGLFVDYDVANLNLAPSTLFPRHRVDGMWLSPVMTPAFIGTWEFVKSFVNLVLHQHGSTGIVKERGDRPHCSDMTLAYASVNRLGYPIVDLCSEYPDSDKPLLHVGSDRVAKAGIPKLKAFQSVTMGPPIFAVLNKQ